METDATRMCELLVGLPDVNVVGVGDWPEFLRIAITTRSERPTCPACGGSVWLHDRLEVELVDLPCFGRRTRLIWTKRRWRCPNVVCPVVTFVELGGDIGHGAAVTADLHRRPTRSASGEQHRRGRDPLVDVRP